MTTKTQANGNATKAAKPANETPHNLPAKLEAKTEAVEVKSLETVDDKIRKVMALGELVHQRRTLLSHLERVESLKFGEFDERDYIELRSSTGQSYPIKSVSLCKKVANLIRHEILGHVSEVEEQIQL